MWIDRQQVALGVALLIPAALYLWLLSVPGPLLDEVVHAGQVDLFLDEGWVGHPRLTMVPGWHALASALAWITGVRSLALLRGLGALAATLWVLGGWWVARRLAPERAGVRTLQITTLPLAAPLFPLFYTDVVGGALLLLAFAATLRRRFGWAAAACVGMVLVRHSLAGFVAWLALVAAFDPSSRRRDLWPFVVPLGLFGIMLASMGGASFGDHEFHPEGLTTGNLPFAALVAVVLLLPGHLRAIPRVLRLLRDRPELAIILVTLGACVAITAQADHPFNARDIDYTLYNRWVEWLFDTAGGRAVLFVASVYAPLSFATWRWKLPGFPLLFGLFVLRMASSWLVEPRYCVPFVALILLARDEEPGWLEWTYVPAYAVASYLFVAGAVSGEWFPL